jgi:HAE1 family hydrophobic/amphiphilic exporter-1
MRISDFSVERPVTITMIVLAIILIGSISLSNLSLELLPDTDMPFLMIRTSYDGASPEEIEESVTKVIEESAATLDGLDSLSSTSSEGSSLVSLEMEYGTDLTEAKNDMRDLISRIEDSLPDDADDPQILSFDPNSEAIMTLSISGKSLGDLKSIAEDTISPALERISGVASVDISGGLKREIQINVNQQQLKGYGLNLSDISSAVSEVDANVSSGYIDEGNKEIMVRAIGDFNSISELRNLEIITSSGEPISLGDLAEVKDAYADRDNYSYLNGQSSLGLSIQKDGEGNTVEAAAAVLEELDSLKKQLPDLNTYVVDNSAEDIEDSIANVGQTFVLGGILAIIILFVFLRHIGSTFVIATAIPISVIATFALMYFGDLTLNMMTLGGLALGVGMLLDNSIVVLENIYRHRVGGADRFNAAKIGASEVGTAIFASTMTTAAVFLPVVFIQDMLGEIFTPLALTVVFSLLASLFVALTFVPMLSSKLLHVSEKDKKNYESNSKIREMYRKFLNISLNHRYTVLSVLLIAIIIFGLGVSSGIIPFKTEYMPSSDQGVVSIYLDLAKNTKAEVTVKTLKEAESFLDNILEVDTLYSSVDDNSAEITMVLVDRSERDKNVEEVAEIVRNQLTNIAGAEINVQAQNSMMGRRGRGGGDIEVKIKGSDLTTLSALAAEIKSLISETEGTRNIDLSVEESRNEIQIKAKTGIAKKLSFSNSGIASAVKEAVYGTTPAQYTEAGEEYDITLKLQDTDYNNLDKLKEIKITSATGITVPLKEVAAVEKGEGYSEIKREDQERVISVESGIFNRALGEVQSEIETKISKLDIPDGYTISYGGDAEDMSDSFAQLAQAMLLGIILVYMVMASQFESLIYPLIVMFTVPLSLVGAVIALALTGISLSVQGFIGVIMLVGIVVNNAIVMIDYINNRRGYEEKREAILNAGPIRLRPIMMTTLTTVLGLLPLSLGLGQGSESQQPMAVVVIGGLLLATLLTLIIIPVLYDLIDDWSLSLKNRISHLIKTIAK